MKIKNCVICGKLFEARDSWTKCCSSECSAALAKEHSKRSRLRYKERKASSGKTKTQKKTNKRNGNKSLIAKNTEARKLGMSYGQYAAREAAAAVKVDINIGGNGNVGNRGKP